MSPARDPKLSVLAVGVDPGPLEGCTLERAEDLLGALADLADGGIDVAVASLALPGPPGTPVIVSRRARGSPLAAPRAATRWSGSGPARATSCLRTPRPTWSPVPFATPPRYGRSRRGCAGSRPSSGRPRGRTTGGYTRSPHHTS